MTKHSNISIFVPHAGCPFKCSFCDQNTITGESELPHAQDVKRICEQALGEIASPKDTEIAFFGGSFTAIDRGFMTELLEAARPFVGDDRFRGIRISTRPDCIDIEVLELLKSYGVTAIELGAQSLDDEVLKANHRGHTAADIEKVSALIRRHGFELGLQLMSGLYKSSAETERESIEKVIAIRPDTVRIYPVVILKNTLLARLYQEGKYVPMSFEEVVSVCSEMLERFESAGIKVIKCGLHASEFVEQNIVAGFYHPAFRELCEGQIYRRVFEVEISKAGIKGGSAVFAVPERQLSKALGQKKSNVEYFKNKGINIIIKPEKELEGKYKTISISEREEVRQCT